MKTRVTFRIPDELAGALRDLPNQTAFVEAALRDALGRTCPLCHGSGRLPLTRLAITNLRRDGLRGLRRHEAIALRRLVKLGNELAATQLKLTEQKESVRYALVRNRNEILSGTLSEEFFVPLN